MNNKTLINAGKDIIKNLLLCCTEGQQKMFKLMYARNGGKRSVDDAVKMDINDVVNEMDVNKIDLAISQCERTVEKNKIKYADQKTIE